MSTCSPARPEREESQEDCDFITVSDLCENNHKYMHLGDNHKYVKCAAYFEVCSSVSGKKKYI